MKNIRFFLILLLPSFFSQALVANGPQLQCRCLQNQHPFGLIATHEALAVLDEHAISEPPRSKTGKSLLTYNKYGFDVISDKEEGVKHNWLIDELKVFSGSAKQPMLDVGGGYGYLSHLMLDQGATVIYNDIEQQHLFYGLKSVEPKARERLYLNMHRFPKNMILPANSLSGVVLHRVIHFMKPDEIEEGLAKINRWLEPNGKVFIAVLPPQHAEFRDKVLPLYDKKWEAGVSWPGFEFNSQEILPEQAYGLPKTLHVMDERPLRKALEKYGFVIEKSGFIEMKQFGNTQKRDGKELFGIIARKQSSVLSQFIGRSK